jgi:hydroxyacylglutathione hydrolase
MPPAGNPRAHGRRSVVAASGQKGSNEDSLRHRWITGNNIRIIPVTRGRCNTYFIAGEKVGVLVDTGVNFQWRALRRRLDRLAGTGNSPDYLLLTHAHFDHAANGRRVKERYRPKIIVHQAEASLLGRGESPPVSGTNCLTRLVTGSLRHHGGMPGYAPLKADILLTDHGNDARIAVEIVLMPTPGHSPGSVSVIVDQEIAVVGDAMVGGIVFPPFADDPRLLLDSWRKLLDSQCTLFLPAHGSAVRRESLENKYEQYRRKYARASA